MIIINRAWNITAFIFVVCSLDHYWGSLGGTCTQSKTHKRNYPVLSLSLCHTQTCMVLAVQCLSENNSALTTSSLMVAQSNQRYSGCSKSGLSTLSVDFFFLSRTFPLFPLLLCCQSTRFTWAAAFAFCFWWPVSMLWFSHAGSYKPAGPAVVLMTCPSEHSCYC